MAIIALRNPKPESTTAGTQTATTSQSAQQSGSGSPAQSGTSTRSTSSRSPSTSRSVSKSRSTSASKSSSTSASPTGAVGTVALVVLNQSGTAGLAGSAAQRFRAGGWKVTSTNDDYINDVVTTTAYFDPNVAGTQAAANALQRQFPTIKRVTERFANLTPGPLVVVLTADYSAS